MGNIFGASNEQPVKSAKGPEPLTMKDFDINKYLGQWYEVAHTSGADGSKCNNAIASYQSTRIPGEYVVINTCYVNMNKVSSETGAIKMPDPNSPAKLKVKFNAIFNGWFDYWIYWTDYDNYALVGSTSGHFWILSRRPQMELCVYNAVIRLTERLRLKGSKKVVLDYNALSECDTKGKSIASAVDNLYQ